MSALTPHACDPRGVAKVQDLERAMRAAVDRGDTQAVALRVEHGWSEGVYTRTLHMPAGVLLTGCLHQTRHILQVISGTVLLFNGEEAERVTGFAQRETLPGTKRAIQSETDAILQTIHLNPTDTRDLAELQARIIAPEPGLPPPMLETPP